MSLVGKRNCYTCTKCGKRMVTIDRDEGVTPFALMCRATKECKGFMQSSLYTGFVVNSGAKPTHEWRKPTMSEYKRASVAMRQHFDQGGLDLHEIAESGKEGKE